MDKFITAAVIDKALYLGGKLNIRAEVSCRNNKYSYELSLGEHKFEFSGSRALLNFRNVLDGVINEVLQINPVMSSKTI